MKLRKYSLNESYFEKIDSEEKAYFLGFLFSDGSVSKYSLNLSLAEVDKEILEKKSRKIY